MNHILSLQKMQAYTQLNTFITMPKTIWKWLGNMIKFILLSMNLIIISMYNTKKSKSYQKCR
jgi:hypothetical protein